MQLSFPADKSTQFTFKMGISGTQAEPSSVSVVLERDGKSLSFSADKAKVGNDWIAVIEKPGAMFGSGDVKVSVNVLLNNRLFTPMKSSATIVPESTPDVATVVPVEPAIPQEISAEQVVPDPVTEIVPPAQTEIEKKKKIKDLLSKAQADVNAKKKKNESPQIKMGLLKTIEPINEKSVDEDFASSPVNPTPKPTRPIFTIKKLGTRTI